MQVYRSRSYNPYDRYAGFCSIDELLRKQREQKPLTLQEKKRVKEYAEEQRKKKFGRKNK